MELLFPPNHHFDCNACGKCCRGWDVRVTAADRERLTTAGIGDDALVPFQGGTRLARQADDSCHFLQPDRLCLIHRELGPKIKPGACQQFPFLLRDTPDGLYVGLSYYCDAVARDEGGSLERYQDDIRTCADANDNLIRIGTVLNLTTEVSMTWEAYLAFEAWLLHGVEQSTECGDGLWRAVLACTRLSRQLPRGREALSAAPLAALLTTVEEPPLWNAVTAEATWLNLTTVLSILESPQPDGRIELRNAMLSGQPYHSALFGCDMDTANIASYSPESSQDWRHRHFKRYLQHVVFRKWLAGPGPVASNVAALYTASVALDVLSNMAARARHRSQPEIEDAHTAVDIIERNFLAHTTSLAQFAGLFAERFVVQLEGIDPWPHTS